MNILNISIIIILIIIVLFVIFYFNTKGNIIYDKLLDTTTNNNDEQLQIKYSENKASLANPTNNFTLSLWFYIDNWDVGPSYKNILYMSDTPVSDPHIDTTSENQILESIWISIKTNSQIRLKQKDEDENVNVNNSSKFKLYN